MTGSEATTSRSALVTLTVPSKELAADPLLSIVASVASPYQTSVKIVKKGDLSLILGPDGAETLTHRNAVLRALCGMGLHNALDTFGSTPLLFLGGHAARSYAGASPVSALAVAGISSWMSVASSVRDGGADLDALLGQLDGYLGSRSFVVPCPEPTLADLDLYLAIVAKVSGEALEGKVKGCAHVYRWLEQCGATLEMLQAAAAKNAKMNKIPAATIPGGVSAKPRPLPLFFYGDEDESMVAAAASAVRSATSGGAAKKTDKAAGGDGKAPSGAVAAGGGGGGPTDEQKKAAADKKAKKAAQKAAKQKNQPKSKGGKGNAPAAELTVSALDIRVGKIVKAWEHESSEKLWCEEVDLGEEPRGPDGPRPLQPQGEAARRLPFPRHGPVRVERGPHGGGVRGPAGVSGRRGEAGLRGVRRRARAGEQDREEEDVREARAGPQDGRRRGGGLEGRQGHDERWCLQGRERDEERAGVVISISDCK
ncbi:hypothetical protein THAOC_35519 [Thalassiosira oceanica]|uniref:tRNA-binding domain-containing protein n=1 Tax=Thalassiosira oceanica TaxID=159749 RepID=K0RGY5_THAOC|nr:hypothetical protein THAOC_35519 [Thalassiosira oceanica]|eukprot:EJK45847.1 hypothetical protein THAOC_35519 [Thalassiosira oceanica]